LAACADDVKWTMVGERSVDGKEALREWMKQMEGMDPPNFTVDHMIAEGDSVVCHGDMTMKDKDGKTGKYGFCDIYRLSEGKIVELNSFVVKTDNKDKNLEASA
jgi:ketosteroid isomerase-like protein